MSYNIEVERHQKILEVLAERQFIHLHALETELGVSESTLRRDIIKLDEQKKLRRVRGGAESMNERRLKLDRAQPIRDSRVKNAEGKRALCRLFAETVEDGESLLVGPGSTCSFLAEYLQTKNVRIITNNFLLATQLFDSVKVELILLGGFFYRDQYVTLDNLSESFLDQLLVDRTVLSAQGIHENGVSNTDHQVIQFEKRCLEKGQRFDLLVDDSKVLTRGHISLCELKAIDAVYTNGIKDASKRQFLKTASFEWREAR